MLYAFKFLNPIMHKKIILELSYSFKFSVPLLFDNNQSGNFQKGLIECGSCNLTATMQKNWTTSNFLQGRNPLSKLL